MGIFKNCERCNGDFLNLLRVKKEDDYIHVCEGCREGEAVETRDSMMGLFGPIYMVKEVEYDNEKYVTLVNNDGDLMEQKDLLILSEKIKEFASIRNIGEAIERDRNSRFLSDQLGLKQNEDGLFVFPNNFVRVDRREFDSSKRAWSFKCGNCNDKIGTKTHRYYFVINMSHHGAMMSGLDRACSPECARVVAKDMIQRELPKRYTDLIKPLDDFQIDVKT